MCRVSALRSKKHFIGTLRCWLVTAPEGDMAWYFLLFNCVGQSDRGYFRSDRMIAINQSTKFKNLFMSKQIDS